MSRPQTVFVVDDEPSVRKAVRLILEAASHNVETFDSAMAFLDAYDDSRPGCLVSDVRMPEMDGMALLRRLAAQGAKLPVLMLSAHGDIPMAVKALNTGAIDFLEKPFDADVLRRIVSDALIRDAEWRFGQVEREAIEQLLADLTVREREVLDLLVGGKHAKTIALALGTSHNTVRVQRASIMRKMRADTIGDLMRMMNKIGLLGDD
jgi:two-component system response regulator FixJ